MIQDRKSKKGAAAGLIFAAVVLVLVVLLENLSSLLPSVPAVLQPTSQPVSYTHLDVYKRQPRTHSPGARPSLAAKADSRRPSSSQLAHSPRPAWRKVLA